MRIFSFFDFFLDGGGVKNGDNPSYNVQWNLGYTVQSKEERMLIDLHIWCLFKYKRHYGK